MAQLSSETSHYVSLADGMKPFAATDEHSNDYDGPVDTRRAGLIGKMSTFDMRDPSQAAKWMETKNKELNK